LINKKSLVLKLYFLLVAAESFVVFRFLATLPSSSMDLAFTGYSFGRLVLFAGAAIPFLVSAAAFVIVNIFPFYLNKLVAFVDDFLGVKWKYIVTATLSTMLMCFGLVLLLTPLDRSMSYFAVMERIAPLVYFGGLLGAETLLAQFYWRNQRIYFQNLLQWRSLFVFTGISSIIIVIPVILVSVSGIGLKPEKYGWHTPGTPILFFQLLIAFLMQQFFLLLKKHIEAGNFTFYGAKLSFRFNVFVFIALWFIAFVVWQMEPLRKQSYFNPEPTPPNFQYYPYSDAAFYDRTAQSLSIGEGRNLKVVLRPLYVFFLDVLHMIGGQNYDLILTLQVLCLAVMPALVFLLTSLLGDQSAGILAAFLIIFREKNAIALTNILEVSHSKLLLSDLPTMALMILFIYCLVNWLRRPVVDYSLGIASGASFGLVVLVRSQSQLLLPVLLLGIVLVGGFEWKKGMQRILIFILGALIVVLPWVWRNYQVSGKPAVENTEFYIRLFAGGYSEPTDNVDVLPGESFDDYNKRIKSQIVQYFFNHPAEISRVYASYFIHNEISSVIYLPMSFEFYKLRSYIDHFPFWKEPYLDLSKGSGVMFFFTLALIVMGCAVAFERLGLLGLFPLLIHFTYSLSVVTARISGWRFILPVDWILQVYYCLGLMQVVAMGVSVIRNKARVISSDLSDERLSQDWVKVSFFQRKNYLVFTFFLVIGLSLPLIELWTPLRYPPLSDGELIKKLSLDEVQLDINKQVTNSELEYFLKTESNATILYGRALYPSYYKKGSFWGENSPNLLAASQFNRLQFDLIGSDDAFVFIPLEGIPQYFPHASDVLLVGCLQEESVRALIIKVDDRILTTYPWNGLSCSIVE
jgi:hypothetical protein